MRTTTLLVLTLDEIEGMKAVMPRVKKEWVDQILVADAGSTDGTVEWAQAMGYEVVRCRPGLTNSYREAWPRIRGEVVVYFSPDGNSIPEVIPQLVEKLDEGYSMVTASRYLAPAKSYDDSFMTGLGNRFFRYSINLLLNRDRSRWMTDPLVMFRAHTVGLPGSLGLDRDEVLDKVFRVDSCWIPLLSMRVIKRGVRWAEIPADEPPRVGGSTKTRYFKMGLLYLTQLLREWLF